MSKPARSDYKIGKEYRYAKRTAAKADRAEVRPAFVLASIIGVVVWMISGSFLAFLLILAIGGSVLASIAKRR
jgi:hypothetical protein